jgi:hypothetical protein
MNEIFDLLKAILYNNKNNISNLKILYDYTSEKFVHFSTDVTGLRNSKLELNTNNGKINLWNIEVIIFLIENIRPLMDFYFELLKQKQQQLQFEIK